MNGSFENSRARVRMKANKVMKEDGKEYLKFDKFAIKIQIGKNKLHLKNLFNGKFDFTCRLRINKTLVNAFFIFSNILNRF